MIILKTKLSISGNGDEEQPDTPKNNINRNIAFTKITKLISRAQIFKAKKILKISNNALKIKKCPNNQIKNPINQ